MAALPELIQDGIRYVPTKLIARSVGLSPRYLADFCRDGRVTGVFHKGAWYVEENSLRAFLEKRAREQDEYNRRLSEAAKQEVEENRAAQQAAALSAVRIRRKTQAAEVLLATLTIFAVVASGALAFHNINPEKFPATIGGVQHAPQVLSSQLAAVSSLPWLDNFADTLFRTVCPIFGDCPQSDLATPASQPRTQPPPQKFTAPVATTSRPALATSSEKNPSPTAIIQQPVIERIREIQTAGINAAYVDARIAALAASVQRQFDAMADANATSFRSVSSSGGSSGSVTASNITGTITNAISSALATITSLTSTTLTATNATFTNSTTTNATTTNLYVSGTATIGSGTGVLQSTSGVVSAISTGSNGQVLKLVGGTPTWSTDLQGSGGGAGAWATSSDDLLISPSDTTDVIVIGSNATTTTGTILEVAGNSLFRGTLTSYFNLTAPRFTATSSVASVFPYASTTALTVSGTGYFGTASTSNLTISSLASGSLLKAGSGGAISAAVAGTDYVAGVTGDWTGTLDGYEASALLAGAFSTTSADAWKAQRNFFSTTSADYWETQQTARTADDLTNNSIEDLNDVAAMTENYGDLFAWNGSAWADFATSSLAIALSDTTGTLGATRGGTGLSSVTAAGILLGNYGGTGWQQLATSTLGLLTTHVAEGSNLYYTDARVQSFVHASTTIPKTYSANTFTALQTFGNASTTNLSASYASSTQGFFGSLSVGSLSGFLKATAGSVATALINLASDVTGILPVANGGTGWSQIASGAVVLGNGTGSLATTSAGTNGQVLALVGGTPTWVATSTLATISGTLGVGSGGTGATSFSYGLLYSPGGTSAISNLATSSLNLLSTDVIEGSKLFYTDARVQSFIHASSTIPKSYSDNTWTGSQIFSGSILALGQAQFANSSNFFGSTAFGATGTTTIATNGTLSTPSIIANSATLYSASIGSLTATSSLTAYSGTVGALTATSTFTATNATTTYLDAFNYVAVGRTATTTIRGDGVASTLPYASTTMITATTASTTALVISNTGGTGTRCLQVGVDGTVSANASACGSGSSIGEAWAIGGNGFTGFLAPTTTQKLWIGQASSTLLSVMNTAYFGGSATTTFTSSGNVLHPASAYLNFGTTEGSGGYGFRDNAGTLEFKNSGGTWQGVTTATSGPSFSVNKNGTSQTVSAQVVTKLTWSNEIFDTNNNFASDKFTPTVPGKYLITLRANCANDNGYCVVYIYKNGANVASFANFDATDHSAAATQIIDMNGSTDYLEGYAYSDSTTIDGTVAGTNFAGALIAPVSATAGGWQNDNTQSFLADSTDLVGIGTSTPWGKLAINPLAGDANQFVVGSSTQTSFLINNANKVGVGTTSPWALLSLNAPAGTNSFAIGSSTATYFLVNSSGNVGIAMTPTYKLDVTGDIRTSSKLATSNFQNTFDSTTVCRNNSDSSFVWLGACSSSARYKEDISGLELGLDAVMAMRPVSFKWKDRDEHSIGFIAEEVEQLDPRLVEYENAQVQSVRYNILTAVLAKAIQDLNLKLEDLATTTATSTNQSSFTSRFVASLFARLTEWFADATNGITDFFARRGIFEELCVKDADGQTCLTRAQVDAVLSASAAAGAQTAVGGLTGAPGGSSVLEPPDTDTATTTTPSDTRPAAGTGAVGGPSTAPDSLPAPAAHSGADSERTTSSAPSDPAGSNAPAANDQITDEPPISVPANDNSPPSEELPATGTE